MRNKFQYYLTCLIYIFMFTLTADASAKNFNELMWKALQGDVQAQCDLAFMYYEGKGVEKNYTEAAKWYQEAANAGNAVAQSQLGNMYYLGYGVKQDYTKAVEWYRKAIESFNIEIQNYTIAAKNGDTTASIMLYGSKEIQEADCQMLEAALQALQEAKPNFSELQERYAQSPTPVSTYVQASKSDAEYDIPALYVTGVGNLNLIEKKRIGKNRIMTYTYNCDISSRNHNPVEQYIRELTNKYPFMQTKYIVNDYTKVENAWTLIEHWSFKYTGSKYISTFQIKNSYYKRRSCHKIVVV